MRMLCGKEAKGSLTLSQTTNFRLFQTMNLQTKVSNFTKMAEHSPNRLKTFWLVTSNFSFSHSVFKRLVLQPGLFWERVNALAKSMDPCQPAQAGHSIPRSSRLVECITKRH